MLQAAADKQWPILPGAPAEVTAVVLDNRHRWVEEVRHCYAGIFKLEEPAKVRVLAVELKLDNMIVRGVPLIGFIDRVSEVTADDGSTGMAIETNSFAVRPSLLPTGDLYGWGRHERRESSSPEDVRDLERQGRRGCCCRLPTRTRALALRRGQGPAGTLLGDLAEPAAGRARQRTPERSPRGRTRQRSARLEHHQRGSLVS
jgi:hypothetical protein